MKFPAADLRYFAESLEEAEEAIRGFGSLESATITADIGEAHVMATFDGREWTIHEVTR